MERRNQNISNQCTDLDCPVYSGRSTRSVIGACPGNIPPHWYDQLPRNELNHISLFTRIHVGIQPNLYLLEYLRSPRNDRPNVMFSLFSCGLFNKLLYFLSCGITVTSHERYGVLSPRNRTVQPDGQTNNKDCGLYKNQIWQHVLESLSVTLVVALKQAVNF